MRAIEAPFLRNGWGFPLLSLLQLFVTFFLAYASVVYAGSDAVWGETFKLPCIQFKSPLSSLDFVCFHVCWRIKIETVSRKRVSCSFI